MQLKNKTAVIFGGSGAIGSAAAYALAREGAHGARHHWPRQHRPDYPRRA